MALEKRVRGLEGNVEQSEKGEERMKKVNHTFVICAYKKSPYLAETVLSIMKQTKKSNVVMITSTPNEYIAAIAKEYGVEVRVNHSPDAGTMAGDWNFALQSARTDYITIAHHDDYYEPQYTEKVLQSDRKRDAVIIFTEYFEMRGKERVYQNKLLKIKRIMNLGFRIFPRSRFIRKRILSVGNPICCPAVTFSKKRCHEFIFDKKYSNNLDWEAWIRLADRKGRFLCVPEPLMGHRIHQNSGTTKYIADGTRYYETVDIYKRFWPDWIVRILHHFYTKADISNDLEKK